MSLQRDQSVLLQQLRSGDGVPGAEIPISDSLTPGRREEPFFKLDLARSLQLHRRLALGIALAGLAAAAVHSLGKWPVYTAQSQVYVQPVQPKVMGQDQGYAPHWPIDATTYDSFIEQQIQSATHPDVLMSALHKLKPGSWQKENESDQAAAERLGHAVTVTRLGSSYQIEITAQTANADLSAQIANAMSASVIEKAAHEEKAGDAARLTILREEHDRILKELDADRTEQISLNAKLGVAAIGIATPDQYDDDISKIHDELIKARTEHDEASARLIAMDADHSFSSKALAAEASVLVAADPGLVSMKTSLDKQRALLITQMANLTPSHPLYKQDTQELAQINTSLDSMTKNLLTKASMELQQRLRTDLDRTAGVEGKLNAQLGQMTAAAASATPKLQRANDLATDILRLQNRQTIVDDQLHNVMLENSSPGSVYLAAAAVPPLHSTKSGILRSAMVIGFAGLLLGILAAVGANKLDQKIYIAADVEQVLGFAPMAVLPDFAQVSDGVAEEHMLRLSAGIEYARQQGNLKSCIFTGTGAGTGVTTVATKVRSMLESMGRATVLVDASGTPPPPASHTSSGGPGINEASSQLATQRGNRPTALLQQLAEESETGEESLVITDTAPLSVSAETEYLARFVDAAIIVIESGVTTRPQLREVANNLQRLDVAAVGFVLNRVGLQKADPSFRRSVRDIEQHLRAQSRSYARGTERSSPAAAARPAKRERGSQEVAAEAQAEAPAAPQSEHVAEAAVRPPMPSVPKLPAAPPEAATVRPRASRMPRAEEVSRSAQGPASAARPTQYVQRPPKVQQSPAPQAAQPEQPEMAREPQKSAAPQPLPVREPQTAAVSQPVAEAPRQDSKTPPAQSWDRVATRLDDIRPEPAREEIPQQLETAYNTATRMSGLRNLIFSLGMKNMNQTREAPEQVAEVAPPVEPVRERPVYLHSYPPIPPAPERNEAAYASPTLVTAPPEFLPPKPLLETTEKERFPQNSTKGRRDRRDTYDDVEILPSWRGQYKKKS